MPKIPVRTDKLDIEKCVVNAGGRFNLALVAANLARKIARDNRSSDKFEHNHPAVTALLQIQEGK
ncbi:MAG: DNA-directed RNA polymerase subunit omega [Burkholderiaceae bacterium]|nr:DNA-directed RNA polymerase subunit omega [Burkholderiaceae bacterium]